MYKRQVLNFLDPSILSISPDLRQIALIIILLKAGLSLNPADLKKVGRPAVMMAFIPACFEIAAFLLFAPSILHITETEALLMGSVLAAVSPAEMCIRDRVFIYQQTRRLVRCLFPPSCLRDLITFHRDRQSAG